MTVKFYCISDERNLLIKKLVDTGAGANLIATSATVRYKEDVDILNPTLEIAYSSDLTKCNYIYVQEWKRYYFVNNIVAGMQRLFFDCHVDVLTTYATDIKKLDCIIARQENKYNTYLNDGIWRNLQARDVLTKRFKRNGNSTSFYRPCNFILTTGGEV